MQACDTRTQQQQLDAPAAARRHQHMKAENEGEMQRWSVCEPASASYGLCVCVHGCMPQRQRQHDAASASCVRAVLGSSHHNTH